MKKIISQLFIFIISLLIIGLIIYLGHFFSNLRNENQVFLNNLQSSTNNIFDAFNQNLNQLKKETNLNNLFYLTTLLKFNKDYQFRILLTKIIDDYKIITSEQFLLSLLNNKIDSLAPLKNLLNNLQLLDNYHLNFISPLKYHLENWLVLLGNDQPAHYLVLIQNPHLPRQSGGFLSAYSLLTFRQGAVSLEGGSIFDIDDLFLEKIIPPLPLQTISNKWFFHDANWFFDFPQTGKKITEFFQKTGVLPPTASLDGVIVVNGSVIESLLDLTGPLKFHNIDLVLASSNFATFFDQQIRSNSQLLLGQNRLVWSEFFPLLFERLQKLSPSQVTTFKRVILNALNNKEIQVYSPHDKLEYYFDSLGWSGKIVSTPNDYLAVVINDLDKHFILDQRTKFVHLESKISSSTVTNILTIKSNFTNQQDKKLESYLQIYLPQGVKIINCSGCFWKHEINDWPYSKLNYQIDSDIAALEKQKVFDEQNNLEITAEGQKTVVNTWAQLAQTPLILTYQFPLSSSEFSHWALQIQKQSGQNIEFMYHLKLPDDKKISPTLFTLDQPFLLTHDLLLNFDINSL